MRALWSIFLVVGALIIGACNTTEGIGEDIESVGDEIDDAAER